MKHVNIWWIKKKEIKDNLWFMALIWIDWSYLWIIYAELWGSVCRCAVTTSHNTHTNKHGLQQTAHTVIKRFNRENIRKDWRYNTGIIDGKWVKK